MMRLSTLAVALCGLVACNVNLSRAAEPSGEKTFKELADVLAGGVWRCTTSDGTTHEHTYRWILNKRFLHVNRKGGDSPGVSTFGLDPATGKATWWGFSEDGTVAKTTAVSQGEGVWKCEGETAGARTQEVRAILTKVNNDKLLWRPTSLVVDGKKEPLEPETWTRSEN